jgi:surface polysaccharide O-acyltransferase-like enzyme
MSEENKNSTNDNQARESTEKEILIDNNDEKPEINASNIEESLIKEINKDIPKTTKRYFGIDLIRVVACFLVMQTHAGEIYYIEDNGDLIRNEKNIWPGIFNSLARVCVPLFVMISGYLLLPMKTDYSTFLKKRFTRVSFPFIAFCIFYDIYYYIRGVIDVKTMLINIPKIFINYGSELGHLWFMYMIMGVYLLIPIFSPWIKSAKKEHFYFYFVIWLISSFSCYIHLAFPQIWGEVYWNNNTVVQGFIGDFGYAVLGAFIKLHLKEKNLYILGIILYLIGSGFTMFGFLYKREEATTCEEIEVTWKFDSINVVIATFGVFLLLRKVECKNEKVVKIFNDIALKSYGMYLIHIFFLQFFKYVFDAPNQFPLWCIFVIAILTFITSYLVIKALSYIPYSQYIIG